MQGDAGWLKDLIRDIPDFPRPGVVFKDLTPLFARPRAMTFIVEALSEPFADRGITKVVGIEARGFIVAAPIAVALEAGFVPVRKLGKLPWRTEQETYELEYGTDALELHSDALDAGDQVLVIDDVLATGGTAAATVRLIERLGASVAGLGFVLELGFLNGRRKLVGHELTALIDYE